jgi:DUF4097 and DUF4098 domain-containing protein YvlB
MRKNNLYLFLNFIAIFLISLQVHSIYATTVRDTFKKTMRFESGGFLSLSNRNGNVEIYAWDRNEVELNAYITVKAADRETAEKLRQQLNIDIKESSDEIIIDTDYPGVKGGGFFGWLFGNSKNSISVQYELRVPQETDLNIHTTNGNVEVEEVAGRLRLESTNGGINGTDVIGLARCATTNGNIKMRFTEVDNSNKEKLSFKTTNGSIELYFPETFGAEAELKTTNGHVDCELPSTGASKKSRRKFYGTINNGGHILYCKTTNGNIDLNIN